MDDTAFRLFYGATWLNFVATCTGRRRPPETERLTSPQRLAQWFATAGLAPQERATGDDVDAAIELREALYELARAAVDGRRPDGGAVRLLNIALAHDAPPAVRAGTHGLAASAPATARAALGRVARQAADHLTGPDRDRLRGCADPTCAGIYLDESGRRRWCRDSTCGVRSRVRAHRARVKP